MVTSVYPVAADSPQLPYIYYAVTDLTQPAPKAVYPWADTVTAVVACCTADYASGAELAEAVRTALDHARGSLSGLVMRSCTLTGYTETWEDDAFVRTLTFTIKI